jgi:hypothetical protein
VLSRGVVDIFIIRQVEMQAHDGAAANGRARQQVGRMSPIDA